MFLFHESLIFVSIRNMYLYCVYIAYLSIQYEMHLYDIFCIYCNTKYIKAIVVAVFFSYSLSYPVLASVYFYKFLLNLNRTFWMTQEMYVYTFQLMLISVLTHPCCSYMFPFTKFTLHVFFIPFVINSLHNAVLNQNPWIPSYEVKNLVIGMRNSWFQVFHSYSFPFIQIFHSWNSNFTFSSHFFLSIPWFIQYSADFYEFPVITFSILWIVFKCFQVFLSYSFSIIHISHS